MGAAWPRGPGPHWLPQPPHRYHPRGLPRGFWRREKLEGIEVLRTPIYAAANRGIALRSLNFASYATSAGLVGPLMARRPDVVIATSPQFLTGLSGLWLSRLFRRPFVFEVRDLWPKSIVAVGALKANSPLVRGLEMLERALYRSADRIVTVTDSFVNEIAAEGIDRRKLSVVKNGVDLDLFRPGPKDNEIRERLGLRGKFVSTYIGTHGMAHGLGTILDVAARLRNNDKFVFLLIGEGAEKRMLQARADTEKLTNVRFLDQQPRETIPAFIAASDLCLVLLRSNGLFKTVIPSKIFEFFGSGRPLALGVEGEAKALVEASGGGVAFPPQDASRLEAVLLELAADPDWLARMGLAGRAYVEANFSRTALARRYLDILAEVTGKPAVA